MLYTPIDENYVKIIHTARSQEESKKGLIVVALEWLTKDKFLPAHFHNLNSYEEMYFNIIIYNIVKLFNKISYLIYLNNTKCYLDGKFDEWYCMSWNTKHLKTISLWVRQPFNFWSFRASFRNSTQVVPVTRKLPQNDPS